MNEKMMQRAFVLQIAMLAHQICNAYRETTDAPLQPPWHELNDARVQEIVDETIFWIDHPDETNVGAAHSQWLAQEIAADRRLEHDARIRPFETLPEHVRVCAALVRGVVAATTYTRNTMPVVMEQQALIDHTIARLFPDSTDGSEWAAMPEAERAVEVEKTKADLDAKRAERDRVQALVRAYLDESKVTVETWNALTEEERTNYIKEYEMAHPKLNGFEGQAAEYEIAPGVVIQAAALNAAAFAANPMEVDVWNGLTDEARKVCIDAQYESMKNTADVQKILGPSNEEFPPSGARVEAAATTDGMTAEAAPTTNEGEAHV